MYPRGIVPVSRQHFIPAAFLGRFSLEGPPKRLRERRLYVAQRGKDTIFTAKSEQLAYIRGLYGPLDEVWSKYEDRLPKALDELCQESATHISGETWLRVLVPFVTCLLLRGPDFEERFTSRFGEMWASIKALVSEDTPRDARSLEIQRLLALVTGARWIVLHTVGEDLLVTSDVGWIPYMDNGVNLVGVAIPVGTRTVLGIIPWRTRPVLEWRDDDWQAPIEHHFLKLDNHLGFNREMARHAQRQAYAPTPELADIARQDLAPERPQPVEAFPLRRPGADEAANEFTWHRLVSVLGKRPDDPALQDFTIDWLALKEGWLPTIVFPLNMPEFPPALRLKGNTIEIGLLRARRIQGDKWQIQQAWGQVDGVDPGRLPQ